MTLSTHADRQTTPNSGRPAWQHVQRLVDPAVIMLLIAVTLIVRTNNLWEYPGINIDEGFYVQQAWSFLTQGELAPGGYRYDHPPFGWILMAGWFGLTGAFNRYASFSADAGREFMVLMAVVTVALLYTLARRLGFKRSFAVLACLLWILSPLANSHSRMALLDNIAVPWLLASMVLVMSPRRNPIALIGGGLCFGAAFLTKEIMLLALPGLAFMVWQRFRGSDNQSQQNLLFLAPAVATMALFPLLAVLSGEFDTFLVGQVEFQLLGRESSGSVFNPDSSAHNIVHDLWLSLDVWLPITGLAATLSALFVAELRGPAVILMTHVGIVLLPERFLPTPFDIVMLPLMALLIASGLNAIAPSLKNFRSGAQQRYLSIAGTAMIVLVAIGFVVGGGSGSWIDSYKYSSTAEENIFQRQAVLWAQDNLQPDDVVVTEYSLWLDIVNAGLPEGSVANPYQFENEKSEEWSGRPTYLIISTYSMPGEGRDSAVTRLAQQSTPIVVFGQDGDYRQMFILRTA